jgi:hypothetical protein
MCPTSSLVFLSFSAFFAASKDGNIIFLGSDSQKRKLSDAFGRPGKTQERGYQMYITNIGLLT